MQSQQRKLVKFKNLNTPHFKGVVDPLKGEGWLRRIKKSMTFLKCSDKEKVDFVSNLLEGWAKH